MITCLGLDVFLELFDINVNETGSLIQTKLLFSWLGSLVLTIYNNRYNIFITKQWSTAQEDQGQKKKLVIHKQHQRVFHNTWSYWNYINKLIDLTRKDRGPESDAVGCDGHWCIEKSVSAGIWRIWRRGVLLECTAHLSRLADGKGMANRVSIKEQSLDSDHCHHMQKCHSFRNISCKCTTGSRF